MAGLGAFGDVCFLDDSNLSVGFQDPPCSFEAVEIGSASQGINGRRRIAAEKLSCLPE